MLKGARAQLRFLLEKKYGSLPEAVMHRIELLEDPERINELAFQAMTASALDELRW